MMGKPFYFIARYEQSDHVFFSFFFLALFFLKNTAAYIGCSFAQCPSSFLLQANINKINNKADMKRKENRQMCVFGIYVACNGTL